MAAFAGGDVEHIGGVLGVVIELPCLRGINILSIADDTVKGRYQAFVKVGIKLAGGIGGENQADLDAFG